MCPVPKEVQQSTGPGTPAVPVAPTDATDELDETVEASNLVNDNFKIPPAENAVENSNIESTTSTSSSASTTSSEGINSFSKPLPPMTILNSCALHAPSLIMCLRFSNCNSLSYNEETRVHHLLSIATDWTLLINRHAANCRNISDEVFPGIHLGDRGAAKNAFYLKKIGVTHVLNTAEGKRVGLVDTNEDFYYRYGLKYMGLKLFDVAQTNISKHFSDISNYIDEALSEGGNVLVNCLKGMSRSSTAVLAYLMLRKNMTAIDALTIVRRHREVCPNDGFLKQLAELDNRLRRERGQLQSLLPTSVQHEVK